VKRLQDRRTGLPDPWVLAQPGGIPAEGAAETLGSAAGEAFPYSVCSLRFLENCQKLAYISNRRKTMTRLTEQILSHATGLPEGAPVSAKSLLHLGNRAAVDQALSRLSERGQLIRAGRGVYLRPITSRFGARMPSVEQAVEALATQKGRPSSRTARLRRTLLA
jgi:hypothetical protein